MLVTAACYALYHTAVATGVQEQSSWDTDADYSVLTFENGFAAAGIIAASVLGGFSERLCEQASAAYAHWTVPKESRQAAEILANSDPVCKCTLFIEDDFGDFRPHWERQYTAVCPARLEEVEVEIYHVKLPGMPQELTVLVFAKGHEKLSYSNDFLSFRSSDGCLTGIARGGYLLPDGRFATDEKWDSVAFSPSPEVNVGWEDFTLFTTLSSSGDKMPKWLPPGSTKVRVEFQQRHIDFYRDEAGRRIANLSGNYSAKSYHELMQKSDHFREEFSDLGIEVRSLLEDHICTDHENEPFDLVFTDAHSQGLLSPLELAERLRACDKPAIEDVLTSITGRASLEDLVSDLEYAGNPDLRTSYHPRNNVKRARHK
jgi:hypothetical protein